MGNTKLREDICVSNTDVLYSYTLVCIHNYSDISILGHVYLLGFKYVFSAI